MVYPSLIFDAFRLETTFFSGSIDKVKKDGKLVSNFGNAHSPRDEIWNSFS